MRTLTCSLFVVSIFLASCDVYARGSKLDQPEEIVFYISTEGNDAWSGTLAEPNQDGADGPFATLGKARDAIRHLKTQGPLNKPVTVTIRGGLYALSEPVIFTPEDSGTLTCPITYAAYPGETPVFSGGRRITGWKRGRGKLWTTVVPGVKEGKWYFRQLFVNDQRRQRARTPNNDFFHVDGEISLEEPTQFTFHKGDIQGVWVERGDVEVVALQAWAEFRMQIRKVDRLTQTVTLSGKCARSNRERNARYWVENTIDALDAPGEWYLDKETCLLHYWPMPGEDITQANVIAPVLEELVRLEGDASSENFVSHIRFRGLKFCHTDWSLPETGYTDVQAAYDIPAVFKANGAMFCSIDQCTFKHIGKYAIEFTEGCKYNHIVGNEMTDLGAGGIKIGETKRSKNPDEVSIGNFIAHNHIHNIGIVYPAAVGVWIGKSSGNTISHNHIHDTFYTGISIGWTWGYNPQNNTGKNIVEFNHIHHIGRGMLSDMGGIYTLGIQRGTVIRNNLFHDISSHGYGGWGIYPDEGSSHILIENNVVYRTKSAGFHQHYGRENIVRNNIFAFGKEHQLMRTRMEPHISFIFEHNIVYWDSGDLLGSNWSDDKYTMDHNIYWDARDADVKFAKWSFEDWKARGKDTHSLIADPLFVDPAKYDFRLKPGSPALKLGFKRIDVRHVGPDPAFCR